MSLYPDKDPKVGIPIKETSPLAWASLKSIGVVTDCATGLAGSQVGNVLTRIKPTPNAH